MARRLRVGTAVLALSAMGTWLLAVSLPQQRNGLFWALGTLVGLSFLGAGIVAWRLHPRNRVGLLMVAVGIAWIPQQLLHTRQETSLFLWALTWSGLWAALACHLFLAFPTGRLAGLSARVVTGFAYAAAILLQLAKVAFVVPVPAPVLSAATLLDQSSWLVVTITGAVVVELAVVRWREGSAARGRSRCMAGS